MHPSERIAPLFARLGSLGELRSLSEPTKIRRRSQKLRPSRGNFCARNWRAPIPTLRANLASRIAGLFARTYAKIRRRTRPPPLAGRVCPVRDANYALGIGSDLAPVPPGAGEASPAPGGTGPPASLTGWRTPITTPREGRQFRAHKLPPPLRGEGRNICDLRSASGPTTRRFSLRKTSIWGPPPREGGP